MSKIQTIYSLKELLEILKKYKNTDKIMVWFDIDLTLIQPDPNDEEVDILIEPDITKELFSYILQNNITFSIITGRYYDIVCNSKKRDLEVIKENILTTIFPFLEEIGLDVNEYKIQEDLHLIKTDKGRCVGMVYKGIIFGGNKGQIIKQYMKEYGFDKVHPIVFFVDDYDPYLKSVAKHIPDSVVLKREIE